MKKINLKKINILKKILIKINRKFGYELIDQNNLILPTSKKSISDNLSTHNQKSISLPLGEVEIKRKVENLLIIFRSFTNENKLLSQNKKRLFEKEKKEYTFRSLNSICKNIINLKNEFSNFKIFLKIIDDNSSSDVKNQLHQICNNNYIDKDKNEKFLII